MKLTCSWQEEKMNYTGRELRPHFLLTRFGLQESALAGFMGSCRVETQDLVDWEDRLVGDFIQAHEMLHFLGEFFGISLREAVLVQRLAIAILGELIREKLSGGKNWKLTRQGDDLWVNSRKLSVSIVTASPVSQLFHLGINIDPAGAPVAAIGLQELELNARELAQEFLERFDAEWRTLHWACTKVRPVM